MSSFHAKDTENEQLIEKWVYAEATETFTLSVLPRRQRPAKMSGRQSAHSRFGRLDDWPSARSWRQIAITQVILGLIVTRVMADGSGGLLG